MGRKDKELKQKKGKGGTLEGRMQTWENEKGARVPLGPPKMRPVPRKRAVLYGREMPAG